MAAARAFRRHLWIFVVVAGALILANAMTGGTWWSFWPLAAWSVALGVHYLVHKTRSVDEGWAEERAHDVHSKSYDASHMDAIADRDRSRSAKSAPQ